MRKFSSRVHRDLSPNPLAELRSRMGSVLDLTVSNPTRVGLDLPEARIRDTFARADWTRYAPDPMGLREAREAVAGYYAERGTPVDPERILITASTSEAYGYLFKLLTEPGDRVLVPRPSYPLFDFLAAMEGVALEPYELLEDGEWSLGPLAASEQARALIAVHPNNPTGTYLRREELARVGGFCRERGLALIVDEVFFDYALNPAGNGLRPLTPPGPEALDPRLLSFTLNGLSKILALPQLKLGWLVAAGPSAEVASALEALELIADTYLSVGTPVMAALPELLRLRPAIQGAIHARLAQNLGALLRLVAPGSGCSALPVRGGWTALLRVPALKSSEEWALELLERAGVFVHPGSFYGFRSEAVLVLSLLPEPAVFELGVERLLDFCSLPTGVR